MPKINLNQTIEASFLTENLVNFKRDKETGFI